MQSYLTSVISIIGCPAELPYIRVGSSDTAIRIQILLFCLVLLAKPQDITSVRQ